jgi:uncharacterized protein YcbK (DUF882 family)
MLDRTKNLSEILASPNEAALSHSNKFDGLHLSPHFSLGELTKTSFKTDDKNEPPLEAVENLITLCENWLEELRYLYNVLYVLRPSEDYVTAKDVEPLVINQGFRSYQVMLKMKEAGLNPSKTSNHMRGCAVDIRCMGVEHALRMMVILIDMADTNKRDFDELFLERRGTVYWLHFAVRPKDNRRKIGFILK